MKRLTMGIFLWACAAAFAWDGTSWVYDTSRRPADEATSAQSAACSADWRLWTVVAADAATVDHGILTRQLSSGRTVRFGPPGTLIFFK